MGKPKKKYQCDCERPMTLHTTNHCWYCGGSVQLTLIEDLSVVEQLGIDPETVKPTRDEVENLSIDDENEGVEDEWRADYYAAIGL